MLEILDILSLRLRYEKSFMGRSEKGFDFLGYTWTTQSDLVEY